MSGQAELPPLLVTASGREPWPHHLPAGVGHLLRDTRLDDLVMAIARAPSPAPLVLDLDSVDGLGADAAALEFVTGSLGLRCLMTRRPGLAARAAELGALSLLRVFALDSTGLDRARSGHPRLPGMGTVISPGILLPSLVAADASALPHPLVSDGMIQSWEDAAASWQAGADTVVVAPSVLIEILERTEYQLRT